MQNKYSLEPVFTSKRTLMLEVSWNWYANITNVKAMSDWSFSYDKVKELDLSNGKHLDINNQKYFTGFWIFMSHEILSPAF